MKLTHQVFIRLFCAVIIIQGFHVLEHIIQLAQVYLFDVAEDDAFGLLGYFWHPQRTEEWLHLGFNGLYAFALYALVVPLWRLVGRGVPLWSFAVFAVGGVAFETWHVVEHIVIISNVIQNSGCPCPGIGDRVLGVTDTQLHFVYNAIAYAATVTAFWFAIEARDDNEERSPMTDPRKLLGATEGGVGNA